MKRLILVMAVLALLCLNVIVQADVSGNPFADGWTPGGNSLADGVYVRGEAGFGFDTYSALLSVSTGSNLQNGSWLVGDTVLGVGAVFTSFTPDTGNITLQAKLGTANALYAAKSGATAGVGSTSQGGNGSVQIKTLGTLSAHPGYFPDGSGTLQGLEGTISRLNASASPDKDIVRLMWLWDDTASHITSWQILLNTSLMDRLGVTWNSGVTDGLTPAGGDKAIVSVQIDNGGAYTDALVTIPASAVPEPSSILALVTCLSAMGGLAFRRRK